MHPLEETIHEMRGASVKGVVTAVYDTGQAQTVDVQTNDGILRTGIEVQQAFGFASAPPVAGATVILLAIGADPGHFVALPVVNHSFRFGNMGAGDGGCVYAQDGSRVFVRANGTVEIVGFSEVHILGENVVIDAPGGCTINGPVTVNGNLTVDGAINQTGNTSVTGNIHATGTISAPQVSSTG